ncbi:MAG TPA: ATP-binding protein, partial [Chthoniobacteraceae bacterium]|nr:ATP-binding protein [Chthoniobacteraceae bacterium]
MSSRVDLRISRSLELLAALKRTCAEFAKREEELARDLGGRRSASRRKYRDAIARVEAAAESQTAEVQAHFASAEERIKTTYNARNARIERLRYLALRNLPKQAKEVRGKWIGDLQLKQVQAERRRDAELKKAEKSFTDCAEKFTAQQAVLAQFARQIHAAVEGYRSFQRMVRLPEDAPQIEPRPDEAEPLLVKFEDDVAALCERLVAFRRLAIPRIFSVLHLSGMLVISLAIGVLIVCLLGMEPRSYTIAGAVVAVLCVATLALHWIGRVRAAPAATALAASLNKSVVTEAASGAAVNAKREHDHQAILGAFDRTCADIAEKWGRADQVEADFRIRTERKIEKQAPRTIQRNAELFRKRLRSIGPERDARLDRIEQTAGEQKQKLTTAFDAESATLSAEEATRWNEIESAWKREISGIYDSIAAMNLALEDAFPAWSENLVEKWTPPREFTPTARFARLELDLACNGETVPKDPRLALPGSAQVSIPLALNLPGQCSLLFEAPESGDPIVSGAINNLILRLLSATPPGKLTFTIFDPVGLGQNFAGLMHLADYEESLINRRIWTQRDQLEDRLSELNEHIEKVIQMYLRNEYRTIAEYNEQAGVIAEKYHFLVVADFPVNFSDTAARRLLSIAGSGARCGVYMLIH